MSDPTPAGAPAKKKPLVMMIVIALVAAAAAGGGAWFFMRDKGTAEAAVEESDSKSESKKGKKKTEDKELAERGLVKMEPFIVNLADEGGKRFLRASIQLVVEDEAEAKEFEEKPVLTMGARSAIVDTLTEQSSEDVGTPEGKSELREALKEHVSEALGIEVVDVLFSDFVIQY